MRELDFCLSQNVQIHPLIPKIECQYNSIKNLIDEYGVVFCKRREELENWKKTNQEKVMSNDNANPEFLSLQDNYEYQEEEIYNLENNCYHSIFILIFSYFESLVLAMVKEKGNVKVRKIKRKRDDNDYIVKKYIKKLFPNGKLRFSVKTQKAYNDVVGDMRLVRNLLVHNYNTTASSDQKKAAIREGRRNIGLRTVDGVIIEINAQYVNQALDKTHSILVELVRML